MSWNKENKQQRQKRNEWWLKSWKHSLLMQNSHFKKITESSSQWTREYILYRWKTINLQFMQIYFLNYNIQIWINKNQFAKDSFLFFSPQFFFFTLFSAHLRFFFYLLLNNFYFYFYYFSLFILIYIYIYILALPSSSLNLNLLHTSI